METEFKDQAILVTGASGFIGSHLSRRLSDLGAVVHGVSRTHAPGLHDGVHWQQCDLRDATAVASLVEELRPVRIFHLAGLVSGDRRIEAVQPMLENNFLSALNLLAAATASGCERIVIAGSLEEPGQGPEAVPVSPYAAAKGAATAYAQMFHSLYGTPVVIARLFMVYGPGQHDIKKLVPYTAVSLQQNQAPAISNGTRPVDWIYIDDVVEGLIACSLSNQVLGTSVDIGSGRLATVAEVVDCLCELSGSGLRPVMGAAPNRGTERVRVADAADASARLGWTANVPLRDGLKRTLEWYGARLDDGSLAGVSTDL